MLPLFSFVLLGLSLVLWLATDYETMLCVDSDLKGTLNLQNAQYHTSKAINTEGIYSEPPSNLDHGVESKCYMQ